MQTLPALKENNISQVLTVVFEAQNELLDKMGAGGREINDRYNSFKDLISYLLKYSENCGFLTGIHMMVGANIPDEFVYIDKKWDKWPQQEGRKITDIDTAVAHLAYKFERISVVFLAVNKPETNAGDPDFDKSALYSRNKTSGRIPAMVGKDRIKAAEVLEAGIQGIFSGEGGMSLTDLFAALSTDPVLSKIASTINASVESFQMKDGRTGSRPTKAALISILKSFGDKKQTATSHLVVEAFRRMIQLRFMLGVIRGISYSSPKSVEGLTIKPNKDREFKTTFENFYDKMDKVIANNRFEEICADRINEFRVLKAQAKEMK